MAAVGVKRIVLFGASEAARIVQGLVDGTGIEVVGVIDRDAAANSIDDLQTRNKADLMESEWDGIMITALEELEEVETQLRNLGLPEDRIWRLS